MNTYDCEIVSNENIANSTYKMVLTAPSRFLEEFKAGQFVHLDIPTRNDLILRRPISVHAVSENSLSLIYKVLGEGTEALSQMKTHGKLNILGPIGNGFPMKDGFEKIALVGGGLGCAPLMSVPCVDNTREYYGFLGFGTADMAYMTEDLERYCERVYVSTDDGSLGVKGNSVDMLKEFLKENTVSAVFVCGPMPMMKGVGALNLDIPVYYSMEERMGCGYGACLTCVCATKENGYKRVCVDGPVFSKEEVAF